MLSINVRAGKITPSMGDCMTSLLRSKTHLPHVPLEANLAEGKYAYPENRDQAVVTIAKQVTADSNVQSVLSQRLTYQEGEIEERNQVLQEHEFELLSTKPRGTPNGRMEIHPYYNVIQHPKLKGWIIKTGAKRIPEDYMPQTLTTKHGESAHFNDYESLLRFELAEHIRASIERHGFNALVANEYAVRFKSVDDSADVSEKYFIISEKLDLLSKEEMVVYLRELSVEKQREFAQMVITIILETGLSDTSFDNVRLTRDYRLAFIDTEPTGLLVKEGDEKAIGGSLEKHARIGLAVFGTVAAQNNLPILQHEVQQAFNAQLAGSTTRLAIFRIAMALPACLIITGYCPGFISNRGIVVKVILAKAGIFLPALALLIPANVKMRGIYQRALALAAVEAQFDQSTWNMDWEEQKKQSIEKARACYQVRLAYLRTIEDVPMMDRLRA